MATFVFVHGAKLSTEIWNQLVKRNDYPPGGELGGEIWNTILPALQNHHHTVFAPTLKEGSLTDHIEQISQLITLHHLHNVILVGASYGGMVITGVANRLADKIGLLVYLDAALPDSGQSLFDLFALAHYPHRQIKTTPAYIEKLFFDERNIQAIPKLYIRCTQSSFSSVSALAKEKINTHKNWDYREIPTSHVPMATHPDQLIQLMLDLGSAVFKSHISKEP